MNDLLKLNNELAVQENIKGLDGKILYISESTPDVDFADVINKILQYVNITDALQKIKKGAEYVVQIPREFQSGLEVGDYFMMENSKTGSMWPSLMEVGEDGRKKIVTPLPIKKTEMIKGNPFGDISTSYHNLYMQKQLNEIAQIMERTIDRLKSIEQGQKSDRIALLNSGKKQIILALNQKDEEGRRDAFQLGRHDIDLAQEKFFQILCDKTENFEPVPKLLVSRFLKELVQSGYLESKDKEYQDIQDYYALYLQSTRMLAASYVICDDIDNAQRVYDMSIMQMGSIDFERLKTIEYAHKDEQFDRIYEFATEYLKIEKQICLDTAKEYDCLSITVSGDKLLEVIADGRAEAISEQEIK